MSALKDDALSGEFRTPSPETGGAQPISLSSRVSSLSLSTKLLIMTLGFVMLAEVLLFVPSVANFRKNWLLERLAAAQIASLALEAAPDNALPDTLRKELLETAGVHGVALRRDEFRQLVLQMDKPRPVDANYDLRKEGTLALIADAVHTLLAPKDRIIRVVGQPEMGAGETIEIVMEEGPLKAAMARFALNIFWLSLVIALITATLVYLSLNAMLVRPMMRITWNMIRFRENPEDRSRIIVPSDRGDELGIAEKELSAMETDLADMLREKSRLAALGLAVSKINHDLRNMLASAQLISDRMTASPDATVQRFAPKLIASLDRAIQLCMDTLKFGKTSELPPQRTVFLLLPLIEEAAESLALPDHPFIRWRVEVAPDLFVDADRDQLFRVLVNLLRNAQQILEKQPGKGAPPQISVEALREGNAAVIIVSDNGPGLPQKARQHLFEPFMGGARDGGTGLGLAISAELIRAHGGTIAAEDVRQGARFRLVIPDRNPQQIGPSMRNGRAGSRPRPHSALN